MGVQEYTEREFNNDPEFKDSGSDERALSPSVDWTPAEERKAKRK